MMDLEALADRAMEFTRNVETNLLTSFHGYGKGQVNLETPRPH
jgi:hypothetical protein